jgi:hypothetical protein
MSTALTGLERLMLVAILQAEAQGAKATPGMLYEAFPRHRKERIDAVIKSLIEKGYAIRIWRNEQPVNER